MSFNILISWALLLFYLLPIIFVGIIILRKTTNIDRGEILFPTGCVMGFTLYIFFLNLVNFLLPGKNGVILSYLLFISLGFFIHKSSIKFTRLLPIDKKSVIFFLITSMLWGVFILWKGNHGLIGSDTNLYYSVAHSFLRGNFPPLTPWQPELPLFYHLGAFELLGSFYLFTGLDFKFLHIFFSSLFIFFASQIIIWIWQRHKGLVSLLFGNITAAVSLISFGFFYIIWPAFPFRFLHINNLHELLLWVRNLPTVNQSIEVYGAPINLDALIYFIFHAFGLVIFLSLLAIVISFKKEKVLTSWIVVLIGLAALALINESIFITGTPALIIGGIIMNFKDDVLKKNIKIIAALIFVAAIIIAFEGGVISGFLSPQKNLEQSIIIFPKKDQIKEDFIAYHYYQQISKQLEKRQDWLPFIWNSIGVDILIFLAAGFLTFVKFSQEQKTIILVLLFGGIFSLATYHFIVPKFLIANGNRFLAFTFIFLALACTYSFLQLLQIWLRRGSFIKYLVTAFLIMWIFLPTIIPPLILLTKNRFGDDLLIPKKLQSSVGIEWIKNNLAYNTKVMVLDIRTPHPSGVARVLVEAGVFSPIFPSDFRVYTIEASPEYLDVAYYLDPNALDKLKINTLLIDSYYFETLGEAKKRQLSDKKYFQILFSKENTDKSWEKVLKIKQTYFDSKDEEDGTVSQLPKEVPPKSKVYIDNEENFNPSYLRRAIIFILRDRDLYFLPQSGVYLNVEANINQKNPKRDIDYNFLLLSPKTNPKDICECQVELLWKGLRDNIYLWRKIT